MSLLIRFRETANLNFRFETLIPKIAGNGVFGSASLKMTTTLKGKRKKEDPWWMRSSNSFFPLRRSCFEKVFNQAINLLGFMSLFVRNTKFSAAFGSSACQNPSSVCSWHTFPEPVFIPSFALWRLKSSFHFSLVNSLSPLRVPLFFKGPQSYLI